MARSFCLWTTGQEQTMVDRCPPSRDTYSRPWTFNSKFPPPPPSPAQTGPPPSENGGEHHSKPHFDPEKELQCYQFHDFRHIARKCPDKQGLGMSNLCLDENIFLVTGMVNGKRTDHVLLDSGLSLNTVSSSLVSEDAYTGNTL